MFVISLCILFRHLIRTGCALSNDDQASELTRTEPKNSGTIRRTDNEFKVFSCRAIEPFSFVSLSTRVVAVTIAG